jgi:class 3 adenylate cyclase
MGFCGGCGARLEAASPLAGRERKTVSVLFCDLVGFTAASDGADPEEVQAALSPYHARARVEIERFGGTVEKFIGDAVMAAFGAPVVHEDDPERAVRAGLALLDAVRDLNTTHGLGLAVRVGVATGEAVVSTGARPERGEGMLAGDVVNTAARLQTAAPVGGVLVGQSTRDATRAVIEYRPHDPVVVKGKADPLPVWVAVRARGFVGEALAESSRPMVGRVDELSALQRAFTRAVREDSVQLVTVVAEPGLGKSRLVQAFSGWVDDREELVTWRQGRCPSYGDAVTYAALGQVVKAQTGILDTDAVAVATAKLTDTVHALVDGTDLAGQESWLVARLAPLVGLAAAETPQEELFTAWRRFLETLAATNPLVLVVEDLHWADPAMLGFLTHLLEWVVGVPLVIIATTRPELYDTTPDWGSGHRNSTTLTLSPLSDVENAQLVASLLGTVVLPADLHAALLARSAGNPLYTREYLNMLTDQTGSTASPDPVRVESLAGTLPGSVQAVIAARLDTLPAGHKQLLQAAAVVGLPAPVTVVQHRRATPVHVQPCLDRRRRLPPAPPPDPSYPPPPRRRLARQPQHPHRHRTPRRCVIGWAGRRDRPPLFPSPHIDHGRWRQSRNGRRAHRFGRGVAHPRRPRRTTGRPRLGSKSHPGRPRPHPTKPPNPSGPPHIARGDADGRRAGHRRRQRLPAGPRRSRGRRRPCRGRSR